MTIKSCATCKWDSSGGCGCPTRDSQGYSYNIACLGKRNNLKYRQWVPKSSGVPGSLPVSSGTKYNQGKPDGDVVAGSGIKHDQGKPDLSIIPRSFLDEAARALMYGEQKYGRENYRKGMAAHRLIAACLRHVTAWMWREDTDPESGLSHLAHAAACLAMLVDIRDLGTMKDDRPAGIVHDE